MAPSCGFEDVEVRAQAKPARYRGQDLLRLAACNLKNLKLQIWALLEIN